MLKNLFSAAMLAACLTSNATDGSITYTYDKGSYYDWGNNKKEVYDVAIRIDNPDLTGKRVTAVTAYIYAVDGIDNTSIWLSGNLKLENKKNVPEVEADVTVNPRTGKMQATFSEPFIIPEGGFYAGYSLTVTDLEAEGAGQPLLFSESYNPDGLFIHTSRTTLKWMDYSSRLGSCAVIEVTVEGDFPECSVSATPVDDVIYGKAGATVGYPLNLKNSGLEPVSSLDYSYTAGTEKKSGHLDLDTPLTTDFVNATEVTFTLDVPSELNAYDLSFTIDKVNGEPNASTATLKGTLQAVSTIPVHRPVMEEYTGTWCGWCTRGWYALEKMNETFPGEFIGIAYHNSDPMAILDEDSYPVEISGFPSCTLDRVEELDPYYGTSNKDDFGLMEDWKKRRAKFSPAEVDVFAWWADEERTTIDVVAATKFIIDVDNPDYSVGYVLCADDLHSSDETWDQSNYFASRADQYGDTELAVLCGMGDPISDLHFNEVAVIANDLLGVPNSLPAEIKKDVKLTHAYSFDLADAIGPNGDDLIQDKQKLFVVALVIDNATGQIINAAKSAQIDADNSSIGNITAPTAATPTSIAYYDMSGRRVNASAGGLYIRQTTYSDGSLTSEKIIHK